MFPAAQDADDSRSPHSRGGGNARSSDQAPTMSTVREESGRGVSVKASEY
jgi:hypothetical protein